MSNNDTDETEVMQKDGKVEETTDTETLEEIETALEESETDADTGTDWKAEALKYKAILERKSKQKIKSSVEAKPKVEPANQGLSEELIDEKILRSQGFDDDAIEEAKYIAGRNNSSLLAAVQDKRFIAFKTQTDEEKRKMEASLGASKGSGRKKSEPSFDDTNLTAEQHREMWEKSKQ